MLGAINNTAILRGKSHLSNEGNNLFKPQNYFGLREQH